MNGIVIIFPKLPAAGMALFPFILVKSAFLTHDKALLNHEKIHLRQQAELLVIPFYILYLTHYLFNLIRYRNHHRAYREIAFEKEAYHQEQDPDYLSGRQAFSWWHYV